MLSGHCLAPTALSGTFRRLSCTPFSQSVETPWRAEPPRKAAKKDARRKRVHAKAEDRGIISSSDLEGLNTLLPSCETLHWHMIAVFPGLLGMFQTFGPSPCYPYDTTWIRYPVRSSVAKRRATHWLPSRPAAIPQLYPHHQPPNYHPPLSRSCSACVVN